MQSQGRRATARGSTVHLAGGGKIEIGNKGERSYHGTSADTQAMVEGHLGGHEDKHVREWAGKTKPEPPAPRARVVDPAKAEASAKAKAERQQAREQKSEARQRERAEKHGARQKVREGREQAKQARQQARAEKKQAATEAIRAVGAPITADGKLDKARVPGATKDFQPLTTLDPSAGFKGRSYQARSAKEMSGELLGAPARGGTNEQILRDQLGNLDVKDPTQWEAIAEKYETGPIATFGEAMAVLAQKSAGGGVRPNWQALDFDALRSCPGLEGLQKPKWLQDADTHGEEQEHMARAQAEAEHSDPGETYGDDYGDESSGNVDDGGYIVPNKDDPTDVPFER